MEITRVSPGRRAEQDRRGKHREALHEGEAEVDGEPRRQQRQEHVQEAAARVGAERRGRLFERRVDARQVGEGQQEGEGKAGDQQRGEDAPVIVDQPERVVDRDASASSVRLNHPCGPR